MILCETCDRRITIKIELGKNFLNKCLEGVDFPDDILNAIECNKYSPNDKTRLDNALQTMNAHYERHKLARDKARGVWNEGKK